MINTLFFFSIRNCAVHQNTRTSICESKMNAIAHAQLAFQILTLQKKNIQNDSVKFLEVEKYVHDKWQIILANNNSTNSNLHNLMIIQENNTVLLNDAQYLLSSTNENLLPAGNWAHSSCDSDSILSYCFDSNVSSFTEHYGIWGGMISWNRIYLHVSTGM